jgi:hypothetical protein
MLFSSTPRLYWSTTSHTKDRIFTRFIPLLPSMNFLLATIQDFDFPSLSFDCLISRIQRYRDCLGLFVPRDLPRLCLTSSNSDLIKYAATLRQPISLRPVGPARSKTEPPRPATALDRGRPHELSRANNLEIRRGQQP